MLVSSPLEAPLPPPPREELFPPPNVLPDLTQDVNSLVANLFAVAKPAREGLLKTLIQPQWQEASSSWANIFRKTKETDKGRPDSMLEEKLIRSQNQAALWVELDPTEVFWNGRRASTISF